MKAKARRSRSLASGTTRMPRRPTTMRSPARRSRSRRHRARPSATTIMASMRWFSTSIHFWLRAAPGCDDWWWNRNPRARTCRAPPRAAAASPVSTGAQPSSSRLCSRRSSAEASGVSTFSRRYEGSLLVRPIAELFHFEAAAVLHDLIEDVLHDVGVDQVAFGFDHFLEWHRVTIVAAYACAAGAKRSRAPSNSRMRTGLERYPSMPLCRQSSRSPFMA